MKLHLIMARIKRLPLEQKIEFLQTAFKLEGRYTVRRNEIESLLCSLLTKQLLRESRVA